MHMVDALGCFA